ncbi:chaperonin-containing T-complex member BBS12-like [Babylonia areolata]|uniref:chaperonin-containing T-complex member BBS12-like n=1 Tax=Babylonia areolata TaxID=304850 RepID=UPI003FD501B7
MIENDLPWFKRGYCCLDSKEARWILQRAMSCRSNQTSMNSNKEAVSVIYEMVKQDLGISESVRCIVAENGEDAIFVKDIMGTLKCLDVQHPAGVMVVQTCQGHKDVFGCGVKSLLFLIGQLTSQVHNLMQQGIPLVFIEELMNEAVDFCIEHVEHLSVPVILSSVSDTHTDCPQVSCRTMSPPPTTTTSSGACKDHPAANVEPPHVCARDDLHQHGSNHSKLNTKGTHSASLAVRELDHVTLTEDHGSTGQRRKSVDLGSAHISGRSSGNIVSPVTLPAVNDILQRHKIQLSSAKLHKNVMLRSRHLQHRSSSSDEKDCSLSGPTDANGVSELTAKEALVSLPEEAQSLSHGCDDMMSWAEEAMRHHLQHDRHSQFDVGMMGDGVVCRFDVGMMGDGGVCRFDVGRVHAVGVRGAEGGHQLLEGLVVSAGCEVMELVSGIVFCPTAVLLINGDLTPEFRHRGYKATLSSTRVTDCVRSLHQPQDNWHCQVLAVLKQLEVRVVLVRGTVNSDLHLTCVASGIALIDHVAFQALKVLQSACRVDFATYVLDSHMGNVCQGVSVQPLTQDWCDTVYLDRKHLVITPPVFVQTLVIRGLSAVGREMKEEEFWHCAARLTQAAGEGRVLRGGGATEQACAFLLTSHQNQPGEGSVWGRWAGELALYRPAVRAALANTFLSFVHTLHSNRHTAGCDSHSLGTDSCCPLNSLPNLCLGHNQNSRQHDSTGQNHCQSCLCVKLEAQESSITSSGGGPCELSDEKTDCHRFCLSNHGACCRRQDCIEKGRSSSKPVLQVTETCADLRHTAHASTSHTSYKLCGHCIPSQVRRAEHELGRGECLNTPVQGSGECLNATVQGRGESFHTPVQGRGESGFQGSSGRAVWDNFSSKVEGWRSAVQCACTVMRMDEVIVTGVDRHTLPAHSVLL